VVFAKQLVIEGRYNTGAAFVSDLESMASSFLEIFLKAYVYNPSTAQAALDVVLRAKLMLRHPETLCILKEKMGMEIEIEEVVEVVIRPHFEAIFPTYVALMQVVLKGMEQASTWTVRSRISRTCSRVATQEDLGIVIGYRYHLTSHQLAWASLIAAWDSDEVGASARDESLDLPNPSH